MPGRLLFVTRKFPPSVGGMETLAAQVWAALRDAHSDAVLVAHRGSNRQLWRWLPAALVRVCGLVVTRKVDFVLVGDAFAYAAFGPMLRLSRTPHATMVMGLDLTFDHRIYAAVVPRQLVRAPCVLAVSAATADVARRLGAPAERVHVVRLGVDAPDVSAADRRAARRELHDRLGAPAGAVVLVTLGRLVRRKGVRWFVQEVLPGLPENVWYAVAGHGPEAAAVERAAADAGVLTRVLLLGMVDDATRELVLRGADLFVQPNIVVPGDMEGFGLVTVEAALRGTPVVAADLEGIRDAVVDGSTGILLPVQDASAWTSTLAGLVGDVEGLHRMGENFRVEADRRYSARAMRTSLLGLLPLDRSDPAPVDRDR